MGNKTPLFDRHQQLGAKMVDFGGWDMPIHYGSQMEEHQAVRSDAGVFDVSHMTAVDLHGGGVVAFLDRLLANDVSRLKRPGQAMYSGMLNEAGGVIDDLIVYANNDPWLAIVNCSSREKDLAWMNQVAANFDCTITERPDLMILAIQGPNAIERVKGVVSAAQCDAIDGLKLFQGVWCEGWFIARTGYTGEKGLEIVLSETHALSFWDALMDAGVSPIGLGARDTLRLEAGMNLYGSDMDETVTPLESNMSSTVFLEDRAFIGADSLRAQSDNPYPKLIGLVLETRGVLRAHYPVFSAGVQVGEITSGAFSPTLQYSIALARVASVSDAMTVEIRGKKHPVQLVTTPFVRHGEKVYEIVEL
ncbi:MAG: aminomethyltransferase [Candidatus Azotimanducaceae bacterium]|jgi:aminomethyltransferase